MKMNKLFCALIAVSLMLIVAAQALAHDYESRYIREEAARRNMRLLTNEQVREIAAKRIGGRVRLKDIDLEDKARKYPNGSDFRPIYDIECVSGGLEYNLDIDAVTGEILKCKLDD